MKHDLRVDDLISTYDEEVGHFIYEVEGTNDYGTNLRCINHDSPFDASWYVPTPFLKSMFAQHSAHRIWRKPCNHKFNFGNDMCKHCGDTRQEIMLEDKRRGVECPIQLPYTPCQHSFKDKQGVCDNCGMTREEVVMETAEAKGAKVVPVPVTRVIGGHHFKDGVCMQCGCKLSDTSAQMECMHHPNRECPANEDDHHVFSIFDNVDEPVCDCGLTRKEWAENLTTREGRRHNFVKAVCVLCRIVAEKINGLPEKHYERCCHSFPTGGLGCVFCGITEWDWTEAMADAGEKLEEQDD